MRFTVAQIDSGVINHKIWKVCCHVMAGAPNLYSGMLDKLPKWVCCTVGFTFASSPKTLALREYVGCRPLVLSVYLEDFHLKWLK